MTDQESKEKIGQLYSEKWKAADYIGQFYAEINETENKTLDLLYDIFDSGKLKGPVKRCLEVGCGPIVHRMTPVSKVCDIIVYSDFSPQYRQTVTDWLHHDGPLPQYHNVFKACAQREGYQDTDDGIRKIEKRLKSKVKDIIPIDLRNAQPIGPVKETFDVVFTDGCLEAACLNYDDYVFAVKGIADVLRPGGYFIIRAWGGGDSYDYKGEKYPSFNQNIGLVAKALQETGYKVLESADDGIEDFEKIKDQVNLEGNFSGCFSVFAQKL